MTYEGTLLRETLMITDPLKLVEIQDDSGTVVRTESPAQALRLVSESSRNYVGSCNTHRVFWIRPTDGVNSFLTEASMTTIGRRPSDKDHHPAHCSRWRDPA